MPYPRTLLLPTNNQDGTAYTGTAALGVITPSPPPEIWADQLQHGGVVLVKFMGRFTSSGTPGTMTMSLVLAKAAVAIGTGTLLCVSSSLTVPASQTNKHFRGEFVIEALSPGLGTGANFGQVRASGWVSGIVTGGVVSLIPDTAPMAAVNLDTTANERILIGVTPSVTTGSWQLHKVVAEYSGN